MPFEWSIDLEQSVAFIKAHGRIGGDDLEEVLIDLFNDPKWQPGLSALCDLRYVGELDLLPADISKYRELTHEAATHSGRGRTAIVTSREVVHDAASLLKLTHRNPCASYASSTKWRKRSNGSG